MKTLKERLSAKLSKNGGFTLVEMLIVVAIIAILIMVSIPMISANLDKAKEATDTANKRSAQSMAAAYYLTNYDEISKKAGNITLYYTIDVNTHEGNIVEATTEPDTDNYKYGVSKAHKGGGLSITISEDGDMGEATWSVNNTP